MQEEASAESVEIDVSRGVTYLRSANLDALDGLVHAVSSRLGGSSEGHFATLNLSYAVGDDSLVVRDNRGRLCAALGIEPSGVVCAEQVHGSEVARVGRADGSRGYRERATAVPGADALVTDEPGLYLWLTFADCVPVLLCDPVRRAIGLAHAGWRGTVGHVARRTVETMAREFSSRPEDMVALVGPAIGGCCYEVGEEVAEAIRAALPGDAAELVRVDGRSHRANLPLANARLIESAGVPVDRVEVAPLCTACRTDLFYSHRAERGRTGRFAAVVGLRPPR